MKFSLATLICLLALPIGDALSNQDAPEQFVEVPPPPPPSAVDRSDDLADDAQSDLEPDVTIIQRKDATYEEYRLNGRLYMVKVVPFVGPPYYFIDRDGDGLMEARSYDQDAQPRVPQWVIFSW